MNSQANIQNSNHASKQPKNHVRRYQRLQRKQHKEKLKEKRARLVVRNLPFSTTEENLREYYERFGEVMKIDLLKRPNGKLVGCAFVQFKLVQNAAKARHHTNGKEFIGRTLECDFALPKSKFEEKARNVEVKEEPVSIKAEVKEEPMDTYEGNVNMAIKTEPTEDTEIKQEKVEPEEMESFEAVRLDTTENIESQDSINEESQSSIDEAATKSEEKNERLEEEEDDKEGESNVNAEEESDDDNDHNKKQAQDEGEAKEIQGKDEDDDLEDEEESDSDLETKEDKTDVMSQADSAISKKPHVMSNDVEEGKTVFIKNVPFDATNQDLKECMSQFGPLYYALICKDKLTEHSKGTAFVKFINVEDAERCLQAGTELTLMGNILDCHRALSRNDLQAKFNKKKDDTPKDSRNLYLMKEGVILANTKAAEGVSAADMAKRLQLEQYKTQMLRNLNMFVSRYRLVVHNIPPSWDDAKLRELFKRHAGPNAIIKEARIMRNMKDVDSKGVGKSKEYGFVSFAWHEHALAALRALNNNPNIFSPQKRPIVAFSIENKSAVKAKQKRLEISKLRNPNNKKYDPKLAKKEKKRQKSEEVVTETKQFSGVTAKPSVMKMRSRYNLKTQAQLHHESLKKQKKKMKLQKKTLQQKKEDFIRQPAQKMGKRPTLGADDDFSKIVSSYKKRLANVDIKKTKWFET